MNARLISAVFVILTLITPLAGCDLSAAVPTSTPAIPTPTGLPPTTRPGCDCNIQALCLVDPLTASPGDSLEVTLSLTNRGPCAYAEAIVVVPIVTGTTYIPGTVTGGATYDPATRSIRWFDRFLTQAHHISYQVRVEPDASRPPGPLPFSIAIDPHCQHQEPYTVVVTATVTARP